MKSLYQALLDERARLADDAESVIATAEARATSETPGLTPDERTRLDAIEARQTEIASDLEREERRRQRERSAGGVRTPLQISGVHDRGEDRPWGYASFGMSLPEFLDRHSAAIFPTDSPQHPRKTYQTAALGEFLQAVHAARVGRGIDPRLAYEAAAQGAGEIVGSDGGFLLPHNMADDILLRVYAGDILSRVRRRTLTAGNSIDINVVDETSRATGSRHGAVQGYWVDEGTAPTASRPRMAQLSFKLRKVAALGYATDELLADSSLVGGLLFDAFVDELRFLAEDSVVNGTGAGQPVGLLNSNALVSVSKETGQAALTLVFENILNMWARLYAGCRANAVWLVNQDIEPQLYSMSLAVGTGGVPVYLPASGLASSPYANLLARPVIPVEYCATLGTVGDIILTDLSQYWLFDKGEPQTASSIHVAFTTDEQAFRAIYRVDGQCRWRTTLARFKGTNALSCCVALATRA